MPNLLVTFLFENFSSMGMLFDMQEPFECYNMSDIEAGLGLKRKHLMAVSLLVGNDHDLNGVQGIGLDKALHLVRGFSEDEIFDKYAFTCKLVKLFASCSSRGYLMTLFRNCSQMIFCRLYEIGKGHVPLFQGEIRCADDSIPCSDESSLKAKQSHCSFCGHPGSRKAHFKSSCEYCITDSNQGCLKKSHGFKCNCSSCDKVHILICLDFLFCYYCYYLTAY